MDLIINISFLLAGILFSCAAVGGSTYHEGNDLLYKRITKRGWFSIIALFIAFIIGALKEYRAVVSQNELVTARMNLGKQLMNVNEKLIIAESNLEISNQKQLNAIHFAAELEHEIIDIHVLLIFKHKMNFIDLPPIYIAYEFNHYNNKEIRFRNLIESTAPPLCYNFNQFIRINSYRINDLSCDKGSLLSALDTNINATNKIKHFFIPLRTEEHFKNYKVKDLNNKYFVPYLPDNLINLVERIDLVVNNWIILECNVSDAYWDDSNKLNWEILKDKSVIFKTPMNGNTMGSMPPHKIWKVDTYNNNDKKYKYQPDI